MVGRKCQAAAPLAEIRSTFFRRVLGMLLRPEGARFNSPGRRPGIQDDALTSPEGATLDARFPHESVTPADRPRTDGGDLAPQMPSFLARQNTNAVPVAALWLSNIVLQTFLIVSSFAAETFTLALKMTSAMTLLPSLLVLSLTHKSACWTRLDVRETCSSETCWLVHTPKALCITAQGWRAPRLPWVRNYQNTYPKGVALWSPAT